MEEAEEEEVVVVVAGVVVVVDEEEVEGEAVDVGGSVCGVLADAGEALVGD